MRVAVASPRQGCRHGRTIIFSDFNIVELFGLIHFKMLAACDAKNVSVLVLFALDVCKCIFATVYACYPILIL